MQLLGGGVGCTYSGGLGLKGVGWRVETETARNYSFCTTFTQTMYDTFNNSPQGYGHKSTLTNYSKN